MSLSRRTLLAAAAGAALAACAPTTSPAPPGPTVAPGAPVPTAPLVTGAAPVPASEPAASTPTASPTAAPTPAPTPEAPAPDAPVPEVPAPAPVPAAVPTRASVVARYADAAPAAWGLDVPGVLTTLPRAAAPAVALTFDACGGPGGSGYDAALVATLRSHGVPATLFLNARWIDANPAVFEDLAADPLFEIANHGTAHRPLSVTGRPAYGIAGTRDPGEVHDEIAGNLAKLTALLGRPPAFFRSGTAHYDDVATRIAADLGQRIAGFSTNADGGATLPAAQVRRELLDTAPGGIVIAHMNHPTAGTAPGLAAALPTLLAAGRTFTRLSDAFR
ncbi:Peptidoglycan/xylan/chitin deacetylase, PgdA/CDA1 family [Streptomyces sp. TLI_053]|uniref:polysaccharide deacetylase family protein n=1 Tax=Streptomyces sp. TLI_053 TaxID=1855352 RepID=UPI00087BC5E6|nr:polysaccharide deacetylase family protein [Streptomyces sp. TLI_053]SDT81515.1 Peptidoglycan/xylan/chitin deacetylase, PgdA/CDA1 family [Streptomyces sp. TLI_053]